MCPNSHIKPAYQLSMSALFSKALFTIDRSRAGSKDASYRALSATKTLLTTGLSLAALYSAPAALADTLTVTVNNIKEAGEIHVAVYDNAEAFEADRGEKGGAAPGITDGTIEMVEPGSVTYVYELPPGTYAIGIFHDVNLNNKMDNNFFGIPKEQYGFSNNARAFLGPPAFEAAAFELKGETTQSIDL